MADSWNDAPVVDEAAPLSDIKNLSIVAPLAPKDQASAQVAREKGWVAPTQSNYNIAAPNDAVGLNDNEPVYTNQAAESTTRFATHAAKYEYKDEYGDVAPAIRELEDQLFGSTLRIQVGNEFEYLRGIKVVTEGTERALPIQDFKDAGLHPVMLDNLDKCGYQVPTPIQCYTIPAVLQGRDVIGIAQTGSGKTAAYLAPALSKLMGKAKKLRGPRGDRVRAEPLLLVVVPTRELCIQVFDEVRRLCYRSMLRPCIAYGGGPLRDQREDLRKACDVLIATPGRLLDFLRDPELLSLQRLRFTIMLHDDWQEEFTQIMSGGGATQDAQHQYLLFSATFDKRLRGLAKNYLQSDFVRIRVGRTGSTVKNIKQQVIWVDGNKKQDALYDLIMSGPPARTLVFVKSKMTVDKVDDFLFHKGLPCTSIHSDRSQLEREDAIRAFRGGNCPILITTGLSARGLDIKNVLHVINYDLPQIEHGGADEYIHRIGRTGRLGNPGLATSFYNDHDTDLGPFLAKILVENGATVPDFLEEAKPAADSETLDFDDDSDDEEEVTASGGFGGANAEDGWGTPAAAAAATQNGDDSPVEGSWSAYGTPAPATPAAW